MGLFDAQISFLRSIKEELIEESFREVIGEYGFVIKDYIVNKQLFQKGIDGNEKRLEGYKRTTIRLKISKGQPVDRTTLHDEEEFVRSIVVQETQDGFEISSDVPHDKFIVKKYGLNVLAPSRKNMKEFMEVYFLPKLKQNVNNKITE